MRSRIALRLCLACVCPTGAHAETAAQEKEKPVRPVPNTFEELVEIGREELCARTAAHRQMWEIDKADWEYNQTEGALKFTHPDGRVITAPAQIIGSINETRNTWLWGWDNPSVQDHLKRDALETRAYG